MKQKIVILLSLILFLAAVGLIVRDLFAPEPPAETAICCGDDLATYKKIDSSQIGYIRISCLQTGLKGLHALTVDSSGRIIAGGEHCLAVYLPGKTTPVVYTVNQDIHCLAVGQNNILAGAGNQLLTFTMEGKLKGNLTPYKSESFFTSLALDNDRLFLADAGTKQVLICTPQGKLLSFFGKKDTTTHAEGFIIPSLYFDLAMGSFHDLWVVNPGRLRLENYSKDGNLQTSWGKASHEDKGFTGCCNPAHICLLPDGYFVTYEKGLDKIKLFDPTGKFQCYVAGAGSFNGENDFNTGNLNLVKDIASDSQGNIYILDLYNQINIFRKKDK